MFGGRRAPAATDAATIGSESAVDSTTTSAEATTASAAPEVEASGNGPVVENDFDLPVLIESEDVSDGSSMILNLGLHDSVFKTVDDPIDLTALHMRVVIASL